jgi:hypothetical protein
MGSEALIVIPQACELLVLSEEEPGQSFGTRDEHKRVKLKNRRAMRKVKSVGGTRRSNTLRYVDSTSPEITISQGLRGESIEYLKLQSGFH